MAAYTISERALEDLDKIWMYTAEIWSIEQADRYFNLIFDEIEFIAEHIESASDYGHVRENYRCARVKSHLIFFRQTKSGVLEVIRVLHERMDVENRLGM